MSNDRKRSVGFDHYRSDAGKVAATSRADRGQYLVLGDTCHAEHVVQIPPVIEQKLWLSDDVVADPFEPHAEPCD